MKPNSLRASSKPRSVSEVVYSVDETGQDIAILNLSQGHKAKLNKEDWERISEKYPCWHLAADGKGHPYARTNVHGAPRRKGGRCKLTLQRAVMAALPGERVGFINGDQMDCRRSNLTFLHQHFERDDSWAAIDDPPNQGAEAEGHEAAPLPVTPHTTLHIH